MNTKEGNESLCGIDWSERHHDVALVDQDGTLIAKRRIGESVEGFAELLTLLAEAGDSPEEPIPVYVSAFGPKAADVAGRIGDGFITTAPDEETIKAFRDSGGVGKPVQAGYKVCWGPDDDVCIDTAYRIWGNSGVPGELSQVLPSPRHFEQVTSLVGLPVENAKSSVSPPLSR